MENYWAKALTQAWADTKKSFGLNEKTAATSAAKPKGRRAGGTTGAKVGAIHFGGPSHALAKSLTSLVMSVKSLPVG